MFSFLCSQMQWVSEFTWCQHPQGVGGPAKSKPTNTSDLSWNLRLCTHICDHPHVPTEHRIACSENAVAELKGRDSFQHGGRSSGQPNRLRPSFRGHNSCRRWRPTPGPYRHFLPRAAGVFHGNPPTALIARANGANQAQLSPPTPPPPPPRGRRQRQRRYRVGRQWERHGPALAHVGAEEVVVFVRPQRRGQRRWDGGEEAVHEGLRGEGVSWKVRQLIEAMQTLLWGMLGLSGRKCYVAVTHGCRERAECWIF